MSTTIGRAHETQVLLGLDPLQDRQVVKGRPLDRGAGHVELLEVFETGNAACFRRALALEASREAISASTRVRRSSSGSQRWVLAETRSSAASRRIAASRRRRKPGLEIGRQLRGGRGHHWVPIA